MFEEINGVKWFKTEKERLAYLRGRHVEADIKSVQELKEEKKHGRKKSSKKHVPSD